MYATENIFRVLLIKDLINKDSDLTTPFKLSAVMKHSLSHLRVLFCPCVVGKDTAHVGKKALNVCHQAQKCLQGVFIVIPQHQKGYLEYVPHTRNIISSYYVVFGDIFLSHWHIHHNHI